MRTLIWILSAITISAAVFYSGYQVADMENEHHCNKESKWINTMDEMRNFCRHAPNFIELPTGEIVLIRFYTPDHTFMWNDELPGNTRFKNISVDTLKVNYIINK